jgi:hypothetical protein
MSPTPPDAAKGDSSVPRKPDSSRDTDDLHQKAGSGATQVVDVGGKAHTSSSPTTPPPDPTTRRWAKADIIAALGLLIAALTYLGIDVWPGGTADPPPSGQGPTPGVRKTPVATAKIVNTKPEGYLFAYPGPDNSDQSKKPNGTWKEGQTVTVVCQERHGRPISAPPYPGHPTTSTVWNRIQWPHEMWVPDIYTDLPKTTDKPPAGLPTCDKWSP